MTIIYLCFVHFIADFVCQSREMGQKKSVEFSWLAKHLIIQHMYFSIGLAPILGLKALVFASLNAAIHGVIDWNIWKLYKLNVLWRLGISHMNQDAPQVKALRDTWKYWEDHLFYTTIGLDQFLHISTLVLLWEFLK